MSKSTESTLTQLERVMERALLIECMIQSMEFSMKSMSDDDLTPEEYDEFMEEYRNLNGELDGLYELSMELGYGDFLAQ